MAARAPRRRPTHLCADDELISVSGGVRKTISTLLGGPFHSGAPRLCLPCLPCRDATVCEHASLHMYAHVCIMHLSVCGVHAGMSMSGYVADLANFRALRFDNCFFLQLYYIVYLACDHLKALPHVTISSTISSTMLALTLSSQR